MAPRKQAAPPSREELVAALVGELQRAISAAQDSAPGSVAALSKELRGVLAELDTIRNANTKEVSAVDDLAKRRAARRAAPANSSPAAKRSQPRRRNGSNRSG